MDSRGKVRAKRKMKKREIKNNLGKKATTYFEILILISATIAFSFIVSEEFVKVGSATEIEDQATSTITDTQTAVSEATSTTTSGSSETDLDTVNFGEAMNVLPVATSVLSVSDVEMGCCLKMKNGAICQDLIRKQSDECETQNFILQTCDTIQTCYPGCCIDEKKGTCEPKATEAKCKEDGGKYIKEKDVPGAENCQLAECGKGCCILGMYPAFITKGECDSKAKLSGFNETQYEWKASIQTEIECIIGESLSLTKGACVSTYALGNTCVMSTRKECSPPSEFYENLLCTNPALNTTCTKTANVTCVEGKDEVYFLDSCGNIANIYDASKVDDGVYWNKTFYKNESCGVDSGIGNANSATCGNCNYLAGSRCENYNKTIDPEISGLEENQEFCRDMSCHNVDYYGKKIDKKNGESWCIYESQVGNFPYDVFGDNFIASVSQAIPGLGISPPFYFSKDTVGSRHWKYKCVDGEVVSDPCADYRNEICQEETSGEGENTFSVATCKVNSWGECLSYNSGGGEDPFSIITNLLSGGGGLSTGVSFIDNLIGSAIKIPYESNKVTAAIKKAKMELNCAKNSDCILKSVDIDEGFSFEVCVPRFKPGFNIQDSDTKKSAENICKAATMECTAVYIKDKDAPIPGMPCKWKCVANCNCEKAIFTQQMNEFCMSLGDCGSYVNLEGKPVDGYTVSKAPNIPLMGILYSLFAIPIPGYTIKPNSSAFGEILGSSSGESSGTSSDTSSSGEENPLQPTGTADLPEASWGPVGAVAGATGATYVAGAVAVAAANTGLGSFGSLFGTALVHPMALSGSLGAGVGAGTLGGFAAAGLSMGVMGALGGIAGALLFKNAPNAAMSSMVAGLGVGAAASGIGLAVAGKAGLAGCLYSGPLFIACAAVVAVFILIDFLTDCGEKKEVKVKFTCEPSTPPIFGNCEKCNTDAKKIGGEKKECSQYRCQSLGSNCKFVEDDGVAKCITQSRETNAPILSPWLDGFSTNYGAVNVVERKGFTVNYGGDGNDERGCVKPFNTFAIGIKTDEEAVCKIAFTSGIKYDEMPKDFGGSHLINHSIAITAPTLKAVADGLGFDLETIKQISDNGNVRFFIKCKDWNGNINTADYEVSFCVQEQAEISPPTIKFSPASGKKLRYDTKDYGVSVLTNKPAECRWSQTADTFFDDMTGTTHCTGIASDLGYYVCKANLPVSLGENTFYFKCKDNDGNTNAQDWPLEGYKLIVTDAKLIITSVFPSQDINIGATAGNNFVDEIIQVETEGGADNGLAVCEYKKDSDPWITFFTDSEAKVSHVQGDEKNKLRFYEGTHSLGIRCEDSTGDTVENYSSFGVIVHNEAPGITRTYFNKDETTFNIVTDQNSLCYYNINSSIGCNYDLDDFGILPMEGTEQLHRIGWEPENTYWITCKDSNYGNIGECFIARTTNF